MAVFQLKKISWVYQQGSLLCAVAGRVLQGRRIVLPPRYSFAFESGGPVTKQMLRQEIERCYPELFKQPPLQTSALAQGNQHEQQTNHTA